MEARLPSEKLAYLKELLAEWGHRTHATLRDVEVLTGFLQFASQVIPTARAFLRGLYDFESEFTTSFSRRRLSKAARRDIAWWATFAMEWNGIRFISPQRRVLHVYTDASGTKGLGGFFGANWFSVRCPRRHQTHHIQVKEMLAVVHAILCWGDEFRGTHVVFHVDNEAVHNGISNLSIRSAPTMTLLRHFLALACRLDFSFSSVWLSSKENAIADAASRFSFTRMFELAPFLDRQPSSKRLQIGGMSSTPPFPRPSHFTFGTGSRLTHARRTPPASAASSTFAGSTACTTMTEQSSLPPNPPSWVTSPASLAAYSPKPSRHHVPGTTLLAIRPIQFTIR
jgi:hypothetical protein